MRRISNIFAIFLIGILLILGGEGQSAENLTDSDQCSPPPSGMTQWWPGEGTANDIQGPTFENGTNVNGVSYSTGKVGQAFSFDGTSKYIEVGNNVGAFAGDPFTIDLWLYSNVDGSSTYILGKSTPNAGNGWDIRLHDRKIRLEGTDGWDPNFNWESDQSITPNHWHHLAISATSSAISVYINGVLKGTPPRSAISSTQNPFRIGFTTSYGGTPFYGLIDEVAIFDRALS